MPFKVFISYSWNNTAERAALVSALEKIDNVEIFYDKKSIAVSESIHGTISEFLQQCDALIALLTRHGLESKEVGDELSRAHDRRKAIIPIVADDVAREDLPWFLRDAHFVVYSRRNFDEAVRAVSELVAAKAAAGGGATAHRAAPADAAAVRRSFARSDSSEFRDCVEGLLPQVRRLVLIGTGLNILQRDPFLIEVTSRAARGECQLEIFLADPASPAVEDRLIEEELGILKPPVGRSGLNARLKTLIKLVERLGRPQTIRIGLFRHYPTFALLILDHDYFVYPYGYATLGNLSPVLRFSKDVAADRAVIEFLDEQYRLVKSAAVDAATALALRRKAAGKAEGLHAFALYVVPDESSELYRFGTPVLGYDVRRGKVATSPWQDQVDTARDFGFHLTLCDVLYFLNETEVAQAVAEVEFLAEEFKPFRLTNLQLKCGFPDDRSAAIVPEDPSGTLEALHHELVHRVYRRAAASNYTLGLGGSARDGASQRRRLMLARYKAPYVLQRFQPHFTLLANVAPEEWPTVQEPLEKLFDETVRERTLRVGELAVMGRSQPGMPWTIEKEIDLEP